MDNKKTPEVKEVETLLVLKQHRASPFGETTAKLFFPGDKYKQNGLDKLQVLGTGYCTRNLDTKVPENTKRKAPKPGEEKFANPMDALSTKIDKLVDVVEKLIGDKKK